MDAAESETSPMTLWRRTASLGASWPAGGAWSLASAIASAAIVAAATAPFAGWQTPLVWFGVMAALVVGARFYGMRLEALGKAATGINPFSWLINTGYTGAALYLVYFFTGAAQTLGVTLYGVTMFQILARDHAAPKRLAVNLAAPVLSMVLVQVYASTLLLQAGQPWRILTLLATPIVVFRAFRAVQTNLSRAQKQARDALAQLSASEARYRLLADRSPDVILRYDRSGIIEYVSPAARHYGYEPDALVGRRVIELIDPAEHARNDAFMDDLISGRPTPTGAENVWRTFAADGEPLAFEGATSVLRDDDGRVTGAMSALRNVTARVALEDELRARRAEAEAANEAKSQFLANMSHEVRTPLTGVVGFARLLQAMDGLPPDALAHVTRISNSAEALLGVVNDVLDFSKLEAGQIELDPHPFDPARFLEETADLVRPRAMEKGLVIALATAPNFPACLDADAARLRQVLLNLLTNAVKFTVAGSVTVAAQYRSGQLRVEVTDTGPGIEPQAAERLFQRFSQLDSSNERQHGGSGLGLAISKGLVEMMGGEIGLRSTAGHGSTFWFSVPAPSLAAPAQASRTAPAVETPADLGGERLAILCVDDVAVNRDLICAMLAPFDIDLTTASSGPEAVEAACDHPFDLILMDLQMPGMDGMAATRAIRATSEINRVTPILAVSANVLPTQIEAARRAGIDDHIAKPINPTELLTKIVEWTTSRPSDDAAHSLAKSQRA